MSPEDRQQLQAAMQDVSDVEMNCGASDDPLDYVIESDLADARTALEQALARRADQ